MKNSYVFELFLYVILVVKIVFLFVLAMSKYENIIGDVDKSVWYKMLQDKLHHLFTLLMGILLTLLFHPLLSAKTVCVDGHTKLFLYAFGVLSIIGIVQHFIKDRKMMRNEKTDKNEKTDENEI